MSSFIRTLQKRILKRQGFTRQTRRVEVSKLTGLPTIISLKKGEGNIIGPDGQDTKRRHYPRYLPKVPIAAPPAEEPEGEPVLFAA